MKVRELCAVGTLAFLLAFTLVMPVGANGWGSPLATDPSDDEGIDPEEDVSSVDVRGSNDFVYFRFVMNYYLIEEIYYAAYVDADKNNETGYDWSSLDSGPDFYIYAEVTDTFPTIMVDVVVLVSGGDVYWVSYNMTANNHTVMDSHYPEDVDNLELVTLQNSTNGEVIFGLNWTWITQILTIELVAMNETSVYLEFEAGWDSDWVPDRTANLDDWIEWEISFGDGGIPGFLMNLVIMSLLLTIAIPVLLQRKRPKL
jgi:hypothetical protein